MGWNNWNTFACDVSEKLLLETSKLLGDYGLKDLGYQYVVLDDCWSVGRGDDGYLIPDTAKFPRGMGAVADELHKEGFLFGMYSSAGEMTCARYAGSLDYEVQDAESFASWGVDYLKYDNCYHMGRMGTPLISFNRYNEMAKALKKTGRAILYSLCSWGEDYVHTWGGSIANSWRVSGDIYDSFARPDDLCACNNAADPACVAPGTHCSVLAIINKVAPYIDRGLPGAWNDLDMLEVGLGGMTEEEYKAHFSMWAALKSPLLLGNDLRAMDATTLSIVNNPAIIALSQDPRGRAAMRIARNLTVPKDEHGVGEAQVWSGPLANGDQVVIFLNAADEDLDMSASLAELFVLQGPGGSAAEAKRDWAVRDLWGSISSSGSGGGGGGGGGARMGRADAQAVLDATSEAERGAVLRRANWYNATEKPYAEGLAEGDARLLGERVGTVKAGGRLEARVGRHAAKVFRLQSAAGGGGKADAGSTGGDDDGSIGKDEL
ncbi:Alpha-galactosidase [Purpureocillium takamizusanense]|uniref:Alpha-galactosidase n=1 Tax=Purpureocillium takamizusanense TaxID=2060973 RepID=A0A9Q8QMK0_9HYPO|nr:Alpha-galactosidase [Purpureocillium takamizusanense]UNI22448.1 Alpha-galactosidase [Purpureocillium takamizusanense]